MEKVNTKQEEKRTPSMLELFLDAFKGAYISPDSDLIRYIFEFTSETGEPVTIAYRVRRSRRIALLEVWFEAVSKVIDTELITEEQRAPRVELFTTDNQPVLAAAQTILASLRFTLDALLVMTPKDDDLLTLVLDDQKVQDSFLHQLFKATFRSGQAVYRDVYEISVGIDESDKYLVVLRRNEQTGVEALEFTNAHIGSLFSQWRNPQTINAASARFESPFRKLRKLETIIHEKGGIVHGNFE